ncbi:hypothetical protein [Priestia flexa]|uniref:hypothetical protein n=1 Tax=Priestia flexa TaxID=86664 RepID=UPI001F4CB240|nr:hypothetical protein [Priestia flexa]
MTINIHYVTEGMSMMLSDQRYNYGIGNEEKYHTDGNVKLINLKNMAWATGSGLYNFVYPFNEKLNNAEISHTDEVVNLFKETMDETLIKYPQYSERMETTHVAFSFIGMNAEETGYEFKIGLLKKESVEEGRIGFLPPDTFNIIAPEDFEGEISNLKALNKSNNENSTEDHFKKTIRVFLEVFEELSKDSTKASRECDIGIHIGAEDGVYKLKVSGHVNDLLDKLNKGVITDYLEVIEKV